MSTGVKVLIGVLAALVLVEGELAATSDRVVLRPASALTYARQDAFAICAEHGELPGSLAYVSDQGGLQAHSDDPCP